MYSLRTLIYYGKPWYYGKKLWCYLKKNQWYYGKNYGTIPETMEL